MIKTSTTGYLEPSSVREHACEDGSVTVPIYEGYFEVCPHPRDKERVAECREKFHSGEFFEKQEIRVKPDDLPSLSDLSFLPPGVLSVVCLLST